MAMYSTSMINSLSIAITIYVIYLLQGIVYPSGSIISQGLLLLFLIIGFISFVNTAFRGDNPRIVTMFIVFYAMIVLWYILSPKTVYGTVNEAIGEVSTLGQFKSASVVFFSFFIAYRYVKNTPEDRTSITIIAIIFYALALLRYFYSKSELLEERESFTNNAGYYFVALLPFIPVVFKRHRVLGVLMMLISLLTILASAKRGAILCLIVVAIFSLFYYLKSNTISVKELVGSLILFSAVLFLGYDSYISNDYLVSRIENTQEIGLGNRAIAYSSLWNHWYTDTNLFTLIFGNGSAASVEVWGNFAHNDWLEILIDYGLVGVIVYLILFITFYNYIRKSNFEFSYMLAMYICLIVWFLKTIFSMGYTDSANAFFMFYLGIIIGRIEVLNLQSKCHEKNIMLY